MEMVPGKPLCDVAAASRVRRALARSLPSRCNRKQPFGLRRAWNIGFAVGSTVCGLLGRGRCPQARRCAGHVSAESVSKVR